MFSSREAGRGAASGCGLVTIAPENPITGVGGGHVEGGGGGRAGGGGGGGATSTNHCFIAGTNVPVFWSIHFFQRVHWAKGYICTRPEKVFSS